MAVRDRKPNLAAQALFEKIAKHLRSTARIYDGPLIITAALSIPDPESPKGSVEL